MTTGPDVVPLLTRVPRTFRLSREAAIQNATMNTQMTERFSAPGATLVKLFGSPATESREFEVRAGRVREIGVRTAMLQSVFMNSLTLMSALALALVYGLGGVLAIGGHLQTGSIVALALLLTRPGGGGITETDRQWSTLLTATAADLGVPIEPVFRADDEHVVLVEPG